jgi:hypothetical protein
MPCAWVRKSVQLLEMLRRHRLVVVPPDMLVDGAVLDDELVLGGAPGVHARLGDAGRHARSAVPRGGRALLIELRLGEVVVNGSGSPKSLFFKSVAALNNPLVFIVLTDGLRVVAF